MPTSVFTVTEHVIPCQYIREYPHAVKAEHAPLRLAIKEYRPLDNVAPVPGSVTIIAAHANGFPKETYEPLFDDLHHAVGGKIRAIWIADCSHQGASGVLNESIQGDDREYEEHHFSCYFLGRLLKEYRLTCDLRPSQLVRPFSRSFVHGQPFPRTDATPDHWRCS